MRHSSMPGRRSLVLPGLVSLVLLVSACGSDDDASVATTEPAATEPAATEPPTTEPAAGESTTTEPTAAESTTTEPDTTEPATTEPEPAVSGPELSVDPADIAAATTCGDEGPAGVALLVHGTGSNPDDSFDPSLRVVLPEAGYTVCTVALPGAATGDVQVSSEYVVGAVRSIAADTGLPVALVAHSQGVLEARWALAFWPDVADSVSMLVAFAGPNAGSPAVEPLCAQGCAAALLQMAPGSALLSALDAAWSSVDVPVTAITSLQDEFVPPESATAIPGAVSVTVQDVCPDRVVGHAALLADTVAVAAMLSALANGGTPDPADVDAAACDVASAAGTDPAALEAAGHASFGPVMAAEQVTSEPELADYAM